MNHREAISAFHAAKDAQHRAWRAREAAEAAFRELRSADNLAAVHEAQRVEAEADDAVSKAVATLGKFE